MTCYDDNKKEKVFKAIIYNLWLVKLWYFYKIEFNYTNKMFIPYLTALMHEFPKHSTHARTKSNIFMVYTNTSWMGFKPADYASTTASIKNIYNKIV